jgi:hypothetical protein
VLKAAGWTAAATSSFLVVLELDCFELKSKKSMSSKKTAKEAAAITSIRSRSDFRPKTGYCLPNFEVTFIYLPSD